MAMIEGYIGLPGAGKTYSLTARVLDERRRYPDRPVFTNYPVKGCTFFEPEDWVHLPSGLIVLDEAHLLFAARASMRLPGKWLEVLSQTRKRGWDILWSSQSERRVDSVLRDVSDYFWHCQAFGTRTNGLPPLGFRSTAYPPEHFKKRSERLQTKWLRYSDKVGSAYDTHGRVAVARHLQQADDDLTAVGA